MTTLNVNSSAIVNLDIGDDAITINVAEVIDAAGLTFEDLADTELGDAVNGQVPVYANGDWVPGDVVTSEGLNLKVDVDVFDLHAPQGAQHGAADRAWTEALAQIADRPVRVVSVEDSMGALPFAFGQTSRWSVLSSTLAPASAAGPSRWWPAGSWPNSTGSAATIGLDRTGVLLNNAESCTTVGSGYVCDRIDVYLSPGTGTARISIDGVEVDTVDTTTITDPGFQWRSDPLTLASHTVGVVASGGDVNVETGHFHYGTATAGIDFHGVGISGFSSAELESYGGAVAHIEAMVARDEAPDLIFCNFDTGDTEPAVDTPAELVAADTSFIAALRAAAGNDPTVVHVLPPGHASRATWLSAFAPALREMETDLNLLPIDLAAAMGDVSTNTVLSTDGTHWTDVGNAAANAVANGVLAAREVGGPSARAVRVDDSDLSVVGDDVQTVLAALDAVVDGIDLSDYAALAGANFVGAVDVAQAGFGGHVLIVSLTNGTVYCFAGANTVASTGLEPGALELGVPTGDVARTWRLAVSETNVARLAAGDFIRSQTDAAHAEDLVRLSQTQSIAAAAAAAIVDSAPGTLDTLNELAAALGDDANFATTVTTALAAKAALAGATFVGTVNVTQTGFGGKVSIINLGSGVVYCFNSTNTVASTALEPGALELGVPTGDVARTWRLAVAATDVATLAAGDRIESATAPANDDTLTRFGAVIPRPAILTESTTARTLALTDAWDYIRLTNVTSCGITVPANATVAFPIGTEVFLRSAAAGTYTVIAAATVTVNAPKAGTLVLSGDATLIKVATNEWDLVGATVAA